MERKKIPIDKIRIDEGIVKMMASDKWWKDTKSLIEKLAEDISKHGLLFPIVVYYDKKTDDYVVVEGNRRLLALRQLSSGGKHGVVDCYDILVGDRYPSVEEYLSRKITSEFPFGRRGYSLKDDFKFEEIPLEKITRYLGMIGHAYPLSHVPDPGVYNLAEHIAQHGLLRPIVVCKIDDEKYEIVNGLRRYHAFNQLNKKHPNEDWDKIPAIIGDDYEKF